MTDRNPPAGRRAQDRWFSRALLASNSVLFAVALAFGGYILNSIDAAISDIATNQATGFRHAVQLETVRDNAQAISRITAVLSDMQAQNRATGRRLDRIENQLRNTP